MVADPCFSTRSIVGFYRNIYRADQRSLGFLEIVDSLHSIAVVFAAASVIAAIMLI